MSDPIADWLKDEDYLKAWENMSQGGGTTNSHMTMRGVARLIGIIRQTQKDCEQLRMQLAACGVVAMENTEKSKSGRISRDNPYWSASYGDVCAAVDREISMRAKLDNAEVVLKELARDPRNRDQTNVYWLAKEAGEQIRATQHSPDTSLLEFKRLAEPVLKEVAAINRETTDCGRCMVIWDAYVNGGTRITLHAERAHVVGVATGDLGPCFLHPSGVKDDCISCQHMKGDGSQAAKADTLIDEKVRELNQNLYGPKYCDHCQRIQPVQTFKLEGSDTMRSEGMTVTAGFTGSQVCTVCHHTVRTGSVDAGGKDGL